MGQGVDWPSEIGAGGRSPFSRGDGWHCGTTGGFAEQQAASDVAEMRISDVSRLDPFEIRWPDGLEPFEGGWSYTAEMDGVRQAIRHGVGARRAFGRMRVRTVTWIGTDAQVEGVEADDYPVSRSLLSRLRRAGRALARAPEQVPAGYESFTIVQHARELDAPYSPSCLAVKLRDDDLPGWALHAWLRRELSRHPPGPPPPTAASRRPAPLGPPPEPDARAIGRGLQAHADALARLLVTGKPEFSHNAKVTSLIRHDEFAFVLAIVAAVGVPADQAWGLPYLLSERLGGLSPALLAGDPRAVRAAVEGPPPLHRFGAAMADWLVQAADIVLARYGGRAARLWHDEPTAMELRRRLEAFPGVGPKQAATAVEILARDLRTPLRPLSGNDVARNPELRRVLLRTGLARQDEVSHMVAAAGALDRRRPAVVGVPAWDIGRRWCRPADPDCPACPLRAVCARLIQPGSRARGG
jgi:endonuclease III